MILIFKWILFALAIMLTGWLIPGINVTSFQGAMLAVVIMALINIFIKPVLVLVTLPINIITLGLFMFVINAFLFLLLGKFAPGLEVNGFLSAFLGSVVLSFLGAIIMESF